MGQRHVHTGGVHVPHVQQHPHTGGVHMPHVQQHPHMPGLVVVVVVVVAGRVVGRPGGGTRIFEH